MFIALRITKRLSPQRGDMFIAVVLVNHNLLSRRRRIQLFVSTFFVTRHRRNMSPRRDEESSRSRKAINMSLLRSEDAPRRSRILSRKQGVAHLLQRNIDFNGTQETPHRVSYIEPGSAEHCAPATRPSKLQNCRSPLLTGDLAER
jgi:hypothetical protein